VSLLAWTRDAHGTGYDYTEGDGVLKRRRASGRPKVEEYWYSPSWQDPVLRQARKIAGLVRARFPFLDPGDAESAAVRGALQAQEKFVPGGAASFETYSEKRIRGAILDDMEAGRFVKKRGREKGMDLRRVELTEEVEEAEETAAGAYLDTVTALKALDDREQYVLMMLSAGYMLRDLAPELGVTMMRVSQIANEARAKVREATK